MIAMIGTSDRLCWLAETCKILLLLLLHDSCLSATKAKNGLKQHFDMRVMYHDVSCIVADMIEAAAYDSNFVSRASHEVTRG